MSHLFHRVHEQAYVAHVMAYSACLGPYLHDCPRPEVSTPHGARRINLTEHNDTITHSLHQFNSDTRGGGEWPREYGVSQNTTHDELEDYSEQPDDKV